MTLYPNLIFLGLLLFGIGFFTRNISRIRRNILIGKKMYRSDNKSQRWAYMIRVALGQSKMGTKPVGAFLHLIVYVGFILINIELLEIVLDGLLGSHRLFAPLFGRFYDFLIGCFEVLAFLVLITVISPEIVIKKEMNEPKIKHPQNLGVANIAKNIIKMLVIAQATKYQNTIPANIFLIFLIF